MNSRMLSMIAAGVLGLCFIFYVISNALPSWSKAEGGSFTFGLWKSCARVHSKTVCARFICVASFGDLCGKIDAARAFMTLACIFSAVTVILLIVLIFQKKLVSHLLFMIIKIFPFVCLLMGILGVALGGNATTSLKIMGEAKLKLGPGAIIGIIALLINLVGAVLSVMIKIEN